VPTVNIGDRQLGRARASSIIDVGIDATSIAAAIRRATAPDFMSSIGPVELPYGRGGASRRIAETLQRVPFDGGLVKRFVDCGIGCSSWQYLSKGAPA
jgi:GDP/UDP-N,N'-diacetylbacillosamine 2-epimerase (hydrolysing)